MRLQLVSSQSQPLIQTMSNFLNFLHLTTYLKQDEQQLNLYFQLPLDQNEMLEERVLRNGPEFLCSVMFYHLYFQKSVHRNISLQFAGVALRP